MTKIKLITFGIVSALLLHSCSKILEPVSLLASKQSLEIENIQEDFEINIQSLTFKSAADANNAPYPRKLMQSGMGSAANVFDEADFLASSIPPTLQSKDYLLSIGDELKYTQLNEFVTTVMELPTQPAETDYILNIGDELTFTQQNENIGVLSNPTVGASKFNESTVYPQAEQSVLTTSGFIGANGNILLLGLGSIQAANRSIDDLQAEVRNILIRNGVDASFQLEITGFNSKKAFVSFPGQNNAFGNNIVPITNLPITLKELVIIYGVAPSSKNSVIITLTRNNKKYRMTSGELFSKLTPRIVIQDRDQIEIEKTIKDTITSKLIVGSRGNILIPSLGSFKAENRSLSEVQADITRALAKQRLVPSFQLEATNFKDRKFFLVTEQYGSKVIPIESSELDLKEAILGNISSDELSGNKFTVVELSRNGISYRLTLPEMLNGRGSEVLIQDGDHIQLKDFKYKLGQVFALSGLGNAKMIPINPSIRETLADILFTENGALNNVLARRSEIYLLRGRNPSVAYHLDAQNVSKILVAAKTELRPNDIVYVADRPIISFSRTLAEINPLRILLRDVQNGDIP
jgi:polysaccharide biosynthesis/export protein